MKLALLWIVLSGSSVTWCVHICARKKCPCTYVFKDNCLPAPLLILYCFSVSYTGNVVLWQNSYGSCIFLFLSYNNRHSFSPSPTKATCARKGASGTCIVQKTGSAGTIARCIRIQREVSWTYNMTFHNIYVRLSCSLATAFGTLQKTDQDECGR